MDVHIAALCATVADGRGAREVPDPCLESKVAIGKGANRTDVDDVARVRIVELLAGIESDLRPVASIEDAELAGLRDLVGEPDAARAQDAALLIEHHVRTDGYSFLLLDLLFSEAGIVEPEVHVEVLEVALSRLIAHGTVERVIGQEEFRHRAPPLVGFRAAGVHDHPVGDGRIARDL